MTPDQPPWPAVLVDGPITLRPIRRRDQPTWLALRQENYDWLSPWDASAPEGAGLPETFWGYAARLQRLAREGRHLPWMIEFEGELVGQLNGNSIERGALQQISLGYWLAQRVAGQGIMPTAVALAFDHCVGVLGLHRVEVAIKPENTNSIRVMEKLRFRQEGVRRAAVHVAGAWCDHAVYALTSEEVPGGLLARWHSVQAARAAAAAEATNAAAAAEATNADLGQV